MTRRKAPERVSGRHVKPIIYEVDKLIKAELDMKVGGISWDQLLILVYAGAMTVSEIRNRMVTEKLERSKE